MTSEPTVLRTPDERFAGLPDYPFAPHYAEIPDVRFGPLRMHFVDEGPRDAPVVLMLHGEPTWSFLYRKIIPIVTAAGYRAVAPDFIGFGRSDKPSSRADYSYQGFVDWLRRFIKIEELQRITLVCQDWGGPIGLRVLSEMPDRFDAVVVANTLLPNCEPPPQGIVGWPGKVIENWIETCRNANDLQISEIVAGACLERPSAEILRGYDAPFPDASYKSAALQITCCIPVTQDMPGVAENRRAWEVLERFDRPFLTAFSDRDPSTKPWEAVFRNRVPGAVSQPHVEIAGGGHFLQEEQGPVLARHLVDLLDRLYR
ncbi:MAG: haloalkane dehalogenase [Rhodospirillales bacterium]|nr:haloalkane dehalogenase [Rhodospirillales bacterium]